MSLAGPKVLGGLVIDRRFNGPPESGNGGYVCGELAKAIERDRPGSLASGICVRLHQPPPLERPLEIALVEAGWGLFDDEEPVALGRVERLDLEVPDAVSVELAEQAATSFRGHAEHVFPRCFVCGPERARGDGLRIFPGELSRQLGSSPAVFASPWRPDPTLERATGAPGTVDPAFVWAALDCPGAFSFPQPEAAILLLGEMTAALPADVPLEETSVLLSWRIEHSGRKHSTGSAIYDDKGECLGFARGTWIEIASS